MHYRHHLESGRWAREDWPVVRQFLLKLIGVEIACLIAIGTIVATTFDRSSQSTTAVASQAVQAR